MVGYYIAHVQAAGWFPFGPLVHSARSKDQIIVLWAPTNAQDLEAFHRRHPKSSNQGAVSATLGELYE